MIPPEAGAAGFGGVGTGGKGGGGSGFGAVADAGAGRGAPAAGSAALKSSKFAAPAAASRGRRRHNRNPIPAARTTAASNHGRSDRLRTFAPSVTGDWDKDADGMSKLGAGAAVTGASWGTADKSTVDAGGGAGMGEGAAVAALRSCGGAARRRADGTVTSASGLPAPSA